MVGSLMPNPSKRKGDNAEREIVRILMARGITAQRVPLSGAAEGMFGSDIHFFLPGSRERWTIEAKRRKDGFKQDYKWLEGSDMLLKRADNQDWLVTMNFQDLLTLAGFRSD
jgi:hypothetical protein